MSTDAFAAAISKGTALNKPHFSEALRTGVIFGVIETLTPLLGWTLGMLFADSVSQWDHWIAFALLGCLGGHMVVEGLKTDTAHAQPPKQSRHGFWLLAITALSTSLDALTVGVSLAFMDVHIMATAVAIGVATLLMATAGIMLGRVLGAVVGKRAEVIGGLVLMGLGSAILFNHLTAPT